MELPGLKQGTAWENGNILLEWQTWTGVGKKGIGFKTQCGNFRIFPAPQILREINFGESGSSRNAVLSLLEISAFKTCKNS